MHTLQRLLIVDDDAAHLEALSSRLEGRGYDLMSLSSPDEALGLLRRQSFDVLVCDLMMPGIDGLELIRLALQLDPLLVPILMTGHGSVDTAIAAMKSGVLDYVLKPFRTRDVVPAVERAFEVRRLRLQNRDLLEQLARNAGRQAHASRETDELVTRIAHDLLASVSAIRRLAGELCESSAVALAEPELARVRRIDETGRHADRRLQQLIAFIRSGEAPAHAAPVDLSDVVEQARLLAMGTNPVERRVEWVIRPLPVVLGDREALGVVFTNLLFNALAFSSPREIARIDIDARRCGSLVEVWVRDNGVGFEPAAAPLFQPFQRTRVAPGLEGEGLGLAMVRRIVEQHGGTVRAESIAGRGATFVVGLRPANAS
jgi:signal transduction histidine kinase